MDACDQCGFDFDAVTIEQIADRTRVGVSAVGEALREEPDISARRPSPERWSMLEYGAHVRDVFLTIRDRVVIGLVEDNPRFKPLYRDERIDLGLYRTDTGAAVVLELEAAAAMFVRLFAEIDAGSLGRIVQYGYPSPASRTVGWLGKQAVHEIEHHLGDMEENRRLLAV